MRFYSQKRTEEFIKTIFKALKSKVWRFSSYEDKKIDRLKFKTATPSKIRKRYLLNTKIFIIVPVFIFAVLVISSEVESNTSLTRKTDTLYVLPSDVSGEKWSNQNNALTQDVDDEGVYQNFMRSNSAYFVGVEIGNGAGSTGEAQNGEMVDTQPLEDDGTQGDTGSVQNDSYDIIPNDEADILGQPSVSEPAQESEQSDGEGVTPLEAMSRGFFKFTNIASALLPLAQESITTDTTTQESVVPDIHENEIVEDTISSEELPTDTLGSDGIVPVAGIDAVLPASPETEIIQSDSIADGSVQSIEYDEDVSNFNEIVFSDFGLPPLDSGQFIRNVQLRMSLAGLMNVPEGVPLPSLEIEYSLGNDWVSAGSVLLEDEVSNALNGGYFLFALPRFKHVSELENLSVRVVYEGELTYVEQIFVDSLWLQIDTETFDKDALRERLLPQETDVLQLPTMYEFVGNTLDFTRGELPRFSLKYESQRNKVISFFRSLFGRKLMEVEDVVFIYGGGDAIPVVPQVDTTAEGLLTIQLSDKDKDELRPGTYTVQITVDEGGKEFTDTFTFQWGVLAINPDQTEYELGDTGTIMMGAVSENGNTLCSADLRLYIIDPNGYISESYVSPSGECNGNNVTENADYLASYVPVIPGTYEMYLEHIGMDGEVLAHTSDTFIVTDVHSIDLVRDGPTRINPRYTYPMSLEITADESFSGELIEMVPLDFVVSSTSAVVTESDGMQKLTWDISHSAGESKIYTYTFDAPDISPFLYTLGPAMVTDDAEQLIVYETVRERSQSLVQESIIEEIMSGTETPVTEEPVAEDVVLEPVVEVEAVAPVEGAPTEDTSVEVSTPVDTPVEVVEVVSPVEVQNDTVQDVQVTEPQIVAEGASSTTATNNFKEHRAWQIASDATGSALLYWDGTTIPSGWTCVSCAPASTFYQRFVVGSSTAGVNGGSATHSHSATGAVTASAGSQGVDTNNQATPVVAHTHTYTPTISTDNNLPPYRNLVLIQNNSAGEPASIPAGAIALFDATVPTGWTRYSAQDGKFIQSESTTTIATTGGANTHTHTASGNTGAAASTLNARNPGTTVSVAAAAHTHSVSTTTGTGTNLPPYRETILGKLNATSSATDAMIAMWTDTPPTGWNAVSSSTQPFENRFVLASTSYGGTGGASTHSHSDMSGIVSGAPNATVNRDSTPVNGNVATAGHTHSVSITSFTTVSHLPPFRTAIFAKRSGGSAPLAPTMHVLFDNEKTGTSTPVFEFTGNDPDGVDTLTYQFEWDDDGDLDDTPLGSRTSDDESGCAPNCFTNTVSGGDTSPFNDNERIQFDPQTTFTSGVTYYWRVRAKETVGNVWGTWSAVQSFTYQSGLDPSKWFQTEGYQFESDTLTDVATTTGGVELSVPDPVAALVVYGEGVVQTPRYQIWNGSSWGGENSAQNVGGTIEWIRTKAGTTRNEYILGTQDALSDVNVQIYNAASSTWGNLLEVTASVSDITRRGFDVAYETISGDALVVYCDGDSDPSSRVWNGSSWTLMGTPTTTSANNCNYISLASDPTSDEIILVTRDTGSAYEVFVWDGSSWGNNSTLGSMTDTNHEGIAVQYEESGDQAMVVTSNGNTNGFAWATWSGGSWNAGTQALGDDFEWGVLKRDAGTDNMALCYIDNDSDIGIVRWNGLSWQTHQELELLGNSLDGSAVSCEFETTLGRDGYLMVPYSDDTGARYQVWDGSSFGGGEASISTIQDSWEVGSVRTGDSKILSFFHDDTNTQYDFSYWNGTSWSAIQTLEGTPSVTATPFKQPIALTAQIFQEAEGTVVTPFVDFESVPNQPSWGEISWLTTEPTGTDVLLQVAYGTTCASLVPDVDLAGNSSGFAVTASPLDISSLSKTTYDRLCLKATLSSTNENIPSLNEWTLSWVREAYLVQTDFIWYVNDASSITPSDPWPVGVVDVVENEAITTNAPGQDSVVRLRMGVRNENIALATSTISFKLQYATATICSAESPWVDVGGVGDTGTEWHGYDNGGLADGATLTTRLLSTTNISATYEEENNSAYNPNAASVGQALEFDWVLQHNAQAGTQYCFRIVTADGVPLNEYTQYPTLTTDYSPNAPTLSIPFDNEKATTTTPYFQFSTSDPEGASLTYQIQIDNDYAFDSIVVDNNTVDHGLQFENLSTPSDKDPFTSGETIEFQIPTTLTNGITYYWRVRAQDPDGSGAWGEWSTIRSFTIDTTLTSSAWHQTTDEQFNTDTFEDTETGITDSVSLVPTFTIGTTTSTEIRFDWGTVGNAWGALEFTDIETSSDLKYKLQYFANEVWSDIPDGSLPGNSVGFDTSPVSLLGLNTNTYGTIRVVAIFTDLGASPTLSDWTVSWGFKILPPDINMLFPSERQATTTPTLEFTTSDPQNDTLVYQVQWSTTYAFTASTTRTSDTDSGFSNISTPADVSPFNSGDVIQYKIQPGDALTDNTTYWWRARAVDPLGSNTYSDFTDPQSFTVSSTTNVSTWFQTTSEQFLTDSLSGITTTGAGSATVATTAVESLMGYAEGTESIPRYRLWDGSVWGTEQQALSVGSAVTWLSVKPGKTREEYLMGTLGTDGDVNMQVYQGGSWGNLQEITTSVPNTSARGFDITYENVSGDAMVVSCDGDADPTYYIWSGTAWTLGGTINLSSSNNCTWVRLMSDPVSDEIILMARDSGGQFYELLVWDGSSWGNSTTLGSMNEVAHEGVTGSYEESGNQAVVVASNGINASFVWKAWNGSAWSATTTVALGDDFEAGSLVSDVGTDNMALCYVDEDNDIGAVRWTGAGFVATVELEIAWVAGSTVKNDRPVDCAFEVGGARDGYIMVAYSDTTNIRYQAWDGAAWSIEGSVSTIQDSARVQLRRTTAGLPQLVAYDMTNDRYDYSDWNGTTWSAFQTLETNGVSGAYPYKEPFMIAPRNPGSSGSVVGDPSILFYDGSGPYWQELVWNDTESGGSSILYQIEYYDGDSWELVSDTIIPGNSTGTSTSPIDLTDMLPASSYSIIRPVANMSCNLGTCPVLNDWTLTWSAGVNVSGTAQAYDQTTNLTSGTVAVALNGTLQVGKTGTISGGTWSISNVNASPGDIITVFRTGESDANEAVAKARYDGVGDISGMRLYERHLTLGSNDATSTPFTNADLGLYDYTNTEDIFMNATGTALSVCVDAGCADAELYVMASTTYTPSGTLTTHDFENNGTLIANGNTITVSGSWDNNATTTMGTSTVLFSATSTTETIDGMSLSNNAFYNVTFGFSANTATWTPLSTLDIDNNLSVLYGTLSRDGKAITIGGDLTTGASGYWSGVATTTFDGSVSKNWSDSNAVLQDVGRVVIDGTSKTVQLSGNVKAQSITIGADDILDASASNYDITVLTGWTNNNTFVPRAGEVIFGATTTNQVITAGADAFYDLTFNGAGGSWSFSEADLLVSNDFRISTGTVTMPTGTTTLAGSWNSVGGVFAHNNSTLYMTSNGVETLSASGTAFTNNFYNLVFNGSGSWSFLDTNATTSNDFRIQQGTVTLPSSKLSVSGNFINTGGTFTHNSGTIAFTGTGARVIDTNASFNNVLFSGNGSWSFVDTSVTVLGAFTATNGTTTLPSSTLTLGGSFLNTAVITHNNGTVLFNSADTGETINLGGSSLYNATFNSTTGGWTISAPATTTNNFTLGTTSAFTLASGQTLAVAGTFTNNVGGASTTWAGSTLSLESGNYSINTKTGTGDAYGTLRVKSNTDIQMWNSTATVYAVESTGSLYSQDHNAVDGDLYIFGGYERTSGIEYWSYGTDFDGTALLASTSRQVDVRLADTATAVFIGSTLSISGTSTATTTVANQGTGSYAISVTNGTTTATHYSFTNMNSGGLSLDGTTKVTTLSDGEFTVSTALGSALSVASTTIDANPQLQIYRVNFSTTTAISAYNVTQTVGVPTSYWWFRESTGNIDGEAFDNDTGDPGSIRWDDSSLSISVSGTVYEDDGVTPMGGPTCDDVTANVRIAVSSGASYTGACSSVDGTYTINGVVIVGDVVLTTYLNTNGGRQGTVVTKTPTANIINHNIYANRIITKHEDVIPLSIADMAIFDATDDSDVRFTVATGTTNSMTVFSNTELHIASSTSFNANGDITVHGNASSTVFDGSLHIDDNATFIGYATSTYTFGGSFTMDIGASFDSASTTVIMNATTTGKTITTVASQEITFNALTFNGVGGGWNLNGDLSTLSNIAVANGTVSGTADITVVHGSLSGDGILSMGSGTTTINESNTLGGTTAWTFGNLVLGSGVVLGTTTVGSNATTTVLGKLTISTAHFLNAGGSVWNLSGTGNVFTENGTFVEATSTVRYSGTGATNILSTGYYNLDLKAQGGSPTYTATGLGIVVGNNLAVGNATTTVNFDTNDTVLDVGGTVNIESQGVLVGSGSASTTIAGSWDNNGTFTSSGGTITFDGGGTSNISAGNSAFANARIAGTGTFTITEHATATATFTLANIGSFTLASGQTLAVGGTFANNVSGGSTVWTGSTLSLYGGGNYSINATGTSDSYNILSVGGNTHIRMWNSDAGTYAVQSTGSLYSQDHASVDGDLYIYGAYARSSGTDYWNYATDFDGSILGSPRNVDVYVASGASILYTGGGLAVVGAPSATTTIQNQGSGTYSFRIAGTASTTMTYYQVRNSDIGGLTFSGTPTVIGLSYGNFEVSQNNGSAITVGGTVINQNQARTFTNNYFGTSGASPAYNVTATGTTVSSWRFTNHIGALAGEANDVDPNGDPGYIVWDDSAALVSISGTVYSDEGTTVSSACDGSSDIHLRVAGLTSYTTNCNAGTGAYTISNVAFSPGDSIIVYIDGKAQKAATVSKDPISSIGNMDLYENRVIVRHENADPLAIVDMAVWDSSDDADIPFTAVDAAPDTLTLPADRKLIVWSNKNFEPNGNVTVTGGGGGSSYDGTLELYTGALFDATGSETHTVGGSLIVGTGGVIDDETSTFVFTTTGSARTIDTNEYSFYNATFNGSGSWTIANTAFDIGNDLTISAGALTLPSGTTTITGSLLVTSGSFNANGGAMFFNSSASETITPATSAFNKLTINGAGSFALSGTHATATARVLIDNGSLTSVSGTFTVGESFINDGTFVHNNGTLRFTSASTTVLTASSSDLGSVAFTGGGSYTFTDQNVALMGTLTIQSGSVALASGTMSIAGSFLNTGGTFTHATGTILMNSSDTGETVNPGNSTFNTLTFASAGGGWTFTNDATTTGNFSLVSASNFTVNSGVRLSVQGVFTNLVGGAGTTWTGSTLVINSGTGYTINSKTAGGDTYNIVQVGSSTALRAWDSAGTIAMLDSASSLYSQDHAGVSGALNIYGNYVRSSGTDYWSYATDFDGVALGGSPRQVYVYHASGASTTVTDGALNIIGAVGFDTTISNQGSGTFGLSVYGGTLNAQYYSLSNMGANGLILSGTTTVTSLTEGNFTLAVGGGSLITLSSTTLNFNAGLVISGASFATTTAITGYNVNLVGSTPSAWTFVAHTGNFDGEGFDVDGGDDCGSIRWDDSTCLLTQQSGYRWRNDDGGEGVPDTEWYNASWGKRKRVTITNADAVSYANSAVKLAVSYDADMQADFDDVRFTSADGVTEISHFRESYTASSQAVVWVKIPTLATSTDTDVYMYYSNGAVSDGSATSTFSYIDTFEDAGIGEYSGDTTLFAVDGTYAYERSYGLDATGNESAKATDGIYRTDVTVSQGQTIRYMQYINTVAGSGDETCTLFGVQSPGSNNQNYAVCLELFGTDRVSLAKDVDYNDTSGTILSSTTITYATGWHEVEIDWGIDDSISVTVSRNGTVVATTSATDATYTQGGVGFTFWFQNGGWDIYSSRPLITTTPSISFGFEQVAGGASWLSGLNTPASGVDVNDTVRARFLVENTGLPVVNQNYRIEFAPKGGAPSCESVSYATYAEVPPTSSCGTSDFCMVASSQFSNRASTTDVMGGSGTFTYGQIVEDSNNSTSNITLNDNEYTELEYAVVPTSNVTDSNYCFRVTNAGTDLDSYAHIAELGLRFAPNITTITFNRGDDISLAPGATTTVYATGTVTDLNGYTDIESATTTMFRSGVTESCTVDANNCYRAGNAQCQFMNCAGDSCDVQCSADIYYHADPTDIGTYAGESWGALLEVRDFGGATATQTAPYVELITLRAISVNNSIDYGVLEVGSSTGSYNASTTIENIGNDSLDISIEGTDLTDGGTSLIPVAQQQFATSTFTYSACVFCSSLSTSPINYKVDLAKPVSTTPSVTDELFWGIAIPYGIAATAHRGTNVFYAIGDL